MRTLDPNSLIGVTKVSMIAAIVPEVEPHGSRTFQGFFTNSDPFLSSGNFFPVVIVSPKSNTPAELVKKTCIIPWLVFLSRSNKSATSDFIGLTSTSTTTSKGNCQDCNKGCDCATLAPEAGLRSRIQWLAWGRLHAPGDSLRQREPWREDLVQGGRG
ncbi:hypothetical protein KQX54_001688 [Cotesia glomerata]|uniref:Uncharacterized protein n=1 Tax=Cotesia glomerata TaxID=32391 RepID=A0AAV7ITQ6_COTGL|nr:hypothetical protein KQX54_001688 [Cotesia glomerata]